MRCLSFCFMALAACASLAVAAGPALWQSPVNPLIPAEVDSGGPDAFGYTYKTSTDPGGPSADFININSIGTLVTGLGDDNYVGPYPLGFSFPFYWYTVNQMWVGSNGYLEFSNPFNMAQPFPDTIPSPNPPNDFLAAYVADWDLSAGGSCYRWSNNADSAIMAWYQVPAWSYGGSHTFETVMTSTDNSVTFIYGTQQGLVSNNDILVGLESLSGVSGLEFWNYSPYIPSNFAIKFYYPDSSTFQVHDLAAYQCGNSTSQGFFQLAGTSYTPTGIVMNTGNQTETGYTARFRIWSGTQSGTLVYDQTISGGSIAPGQQQTVTFGPNWTPTTTGQYVMKLTVTLSGDVNPLNDNKITECHIMALPGTMVYDDGTYEQSWSWIGGNGGMANHFVPPSYPATIDCVRFFAAGNGSTVSPFIAKIFDDDGPNGNPGTELFTATINTPSANQWYGALTNVTIPSGGFYVAWIMQDSLTRPLGVDVTSTQPVSRQGWEFTGSWAPFRNLEFSDLMIRARIHSGLSVQDLDVALTPVNPPIIIPANGGQFSLNATVQRILPPQSAFYVWSRDRFPDGTYSPILLGPVQINPPVNQQVTRLRVQNVPGTWPAGTHWYIGYAAPIVSYPATDADSFPWAKSADANGSPLVCDSNCFGELFPGEQSQTAVIPSGLDLKLSPNPFNPTTTLSYQLSAFGPVSLQVYDTAGRLVSTLVEEMQEAGPHQVSFDGSKLASGIYLVRLAAGGQTAVQKIMLVK